MSSVLVRCLTIYEIYYSQSAAHNQSRSPNWRQPPGSACTVRRNRHVPAEIRTSSPGLKSEGNLLGEMHKLSLFKNHVTIPTTIPWHEGMRALMYEYIRRGNPVDHLAIDQHSDRHKARLQFVKFQHHRHQNTQHSAYRKTWKSQLHEHGVYPA